MIDQEPDFEPRSAARWPWICIAIVIVAGVVIAVRVGRRGNPSPHSVTGAPVKTEAAHGRPVKDAPLSLSVGEPTGAVSTAHTNVFPQALEQVNALLAKGDLLGGREKALGLLASGEAASERRAIEDLLGRIHTSLVFTQALMPEKTNHVIRAGESLDAIARRYKTTLELLQAGNGIANPTMIHKGDVLRPLVGTFRIEVRRGSHELILYLNGRFFKRYTVGTGKLDKTPVGSFVVVDRVREPVWHPEGKQIPYGHPDNILGTRWLAMKATGDTPDVKGYGIHGTWDDASIGKSESAGCIRMRNRDVEELYTLVPRGTAVQIIDK
jgi:lipoprotein-anchoring transpeptidase ErfK/SrfK